MSRHRGRKRHYVKAQTVSLVRDPTSGVLVVAQGGDLGANHKARIKAGLIAVVDREVTPGGMVLSKGAYIVTPGRIDAVITAGKFDSLVPGDIAESRKRATDAATWLREIVERSRMRRRTTGLYQPAQDRTSSSQRDRADDAADTLAKLGRAIGWGLYSALMDAICFEEPLSPRQEELVIEGLNKLVAYLRL